MPPPFYLDWTFWSFVAAAVAVVLSQLRPIREWRSKSQIEVDVYGKLAVDHLLGFPNLGAVIGIRNVGGKAARMHDITVVVAREGKVVATLRAASYFVTPESKTPVIFTPTQLEAGTEWVHTVHLVERLPQNEDRNLARLRSDVRLELTHALAERNRNDPQSTELVEVGAALQQRMAAIFNERFPWVPGEFSLEVQVKADESIAAIKRYRFTLYESDSQQLREDADRYRYGSEVVVNDTTRQLVWVDVAPLS
jgi:hypothetical protein